MESASNVSQAHRSVSRTLHQRLPMSWNCETVACVASVSNSFVQSITTFWFSGNLWSTSDFASFGKAVDVCSTPIHFVLRSVQQVTGGIRKPKLLQCPEKSHLTDETVPALERGNAQFYKDSYYLVVQWGCSIIENRQPHHSCIEYRKMVMCLYVIDLHFVDAAVNDKAVDICTTRFILYWALYCKLLVVSGNRNCSSASEKVCSSAVLSHCITLVPGCVNVLKFCTF